MYLRIRVGCEVHATMNTIRTPPQKKKKKQKRKTRALLPYLIPNPRSPSGFAWEITSLPGALVRKWFGLCIGCLQRSTCLVFPGACVLTSVCGDRSVFGFVRSSLFAAGGVGPDVRLHGVSLAGAIIDTRRFTQVSGLAAQRFRTLSLNPELM